MRCIRSFVALLCLGMASTANSASAQDSAAAAPRDGTVLSHADAQPTRAQRKKISVGPVAGVNFASWTGDDVGDGISRRTGFHAGLQLNADLGRIFGIQTGAMYSQEGTKVDIGNGIEGTYKVNYVRVPFLLRARLAGSGSQLVPYAVVGPSMGIKVSCDIEATDGEQTAGAVCDNPEIGLNLTTVDFGMVLGVGVDFGKFSAGVRYVPGLRSIDDTNTEATDVRNSLLAITAGFAF